MDTETNTPEKEDPPSVASKKPSTSFAGKRRTLLVASQSLPHDRITDPEYSASLTGENVSSKVENRQTAMKHFDLSCKYWKKSSYEDALLECDKVIEFTPGWSKGHNLRGVILNKLNKTDQAILEIREAVRLDPNNKESHEIFAYYESKKNLQVALNDSQIEQSPVKLRRFALEASMLVTFLFIVGTIWPLVPMFTSTDYASIGSKLFTAFVAGFFPG